MRYAALILLLLIGPASSAMDSRPRQERIILALSGSLAEGDILFRVGTGIEAEAVRALNRGGMLSHAGIVLRLHGEWMVVNAEPHAGLVAEPLQRYLAQDKATGFALYRLPQANELRAAVRNGTLRSLKAKIRFDDSFDFSDPSTVYCTEFVWGVLAEAGAQAKPRLTQLRLPYFSQAIMLPKDLINSANLIRISDG